MQPMISVIIPCFNNEGTIRMCVDSLLGQTYDNFEIIVVDDGSDDNPSQALADIGDMRLKPVVKLPHRGVSMARNVGIEQAEGEYIVFVDGDDWVESDYLSTFMDGLKEADCTMILMSIDYPDHSEVNAQNKSLFESNTIIRHKDFNKLFEIYALSSPCNKIYRTELLKGRDYLRFDTQISYAEDLLFNLEYFARIDSVRLFDKVTYHYVKHPVSGTSRYHKNTAYTLDRLSKTSKETIENFTAKSYELLMRHYLWGLINLFHKDNQQTSRQRKAEIAAIISLDEYKSAFPAVSSIGISKILRMLMQLRNTCILNYALKRKFS